SSGILVAEMTRIADNRGERSRDYRRLWLTPGPRDSVVSLPHTVSRRDVLKRTSICMMPELIFIVQPLAILVVPAVGWRGLRLRGVVPLVVVQILVGIALGPTLFGRIAPQAYDLIFNPKTLTPLWGVASIAVLLFGFVTGLHLEPSAFVG